MDLLVDVAAFSLKVVISAAAVVSVIAFVLFLIGGYGTRRFSREGGRLSVQSLNRQYEDMADSVKAALLGNRQVRRLQRRRKSERKRNPEDRSRVYVLDFKGDVSASAVVSLREEISAVLNVAEDGDRVVVRLESAGGFMPSYGLAASQLARVKSRGISLTVCVDKIAASGGYLMASVADRIVAAPFAIVGSIGVIAMLPNLHRFLKSHDVDYEELTAGEFKRTVSVFGEITEKGRAKFLEELEDSHELFKSFVSANRPSVDIGAVATGEHWYGTRALERHLVDELRTSDDFLLDLVREHDLYRLAYHAPRTLRERVSGFFSGDLPLFRGEDGGPVVPVLCAADSHLRKIM